MTLEQLIDPQTQDALAAKVAIQSDLDRTMVSEFSQAQGWAGAYLFVLKDNNSK